ncbi:hypothetical protein AB0L88_33450 [Saccharopolyspora shandongensis]|uniref:hypothetical protein n=1 Tax=Saccharopolyspora shandongensis TaxID=418495 RepID=UPI00341B1B32
MVQDVGFWEAVGMWWGGQKLEDFTMWGWPMLWWARIGKCLQFLGGAVVVLDLIGPTRFHQAALYLRTIRRKAGRNVDKYQDLILCSWAFIFFGFIAWLYFSHIPPWIRYTVEASLWGLLIAFLSPPIISGFGSIMEYGKRGNSARWIAFVLVVAGFLLDLLGS